MRPRKIDLRRVNPFKDQSVVDANTDNAPNTRVNNVFIFTIFRPNVCSSSDYRNGCASTQRNAEAQSLGTLAAR